MSQLSVLAMSAYLIWSLTSLGMIFDNNPWAWPSEFVRAGLFLALYIKFGARSEFKIPSVILYASFAVSMAIALIILFATAISSSTTSVGNKKVKTQ